MMFDMNGLKYINDTFGHDEGDRFIRIFAACLTRILTENSFLARYGGDEFVVYTDQIEHTARRFSAWLPPIQCTLSGHQCMMIIQV